MPRKRNRRSNRKVQNNGAPNTPPNPSVTTVALPKPLPTKSSTDFIRRQYNVLHKIDIISSSDSASRVVSLFGAKDSGVDARCITIGDANNNDCLKNDMNRNQWFRIYNVEVTVTFSPATDISTTCIALESATSAFEIFRPDLNEDRYLALTTYCIQSVPSSTLTRTFKFDPTPFQKEMGIEWCPCSEWGQFSGHNDTYMKQLAAGKGSSVFLNWRRHESIIETRQVSRLWVRYFVEYKGQKGADDIA